MSLGIGGDYAAQRLQSLFSQLSVSQTASTDTSSSASAANSTDSTDDTSETPPDNCLTGSTQAQLSGDVLNTLMQLQGGTSGTTGSGTTDPVQSLFSAMDTDGDGAVSQSEMESYLESNGATQGQADAVYSALNPSGASGGISESQMASAAQSSAPPGGPGGAHHHHHHHASGTDSTTADSNPLDQLMAEIGGTSSDGSISQDAFSSFVTSNGGTASDAASDFAALDTDGSGTLTSADFATTWQNAQTSQGSSSLMVSMLDAFAKANNATSSSSATGTTTSVSA